MLSVPPIQSPFDSSLNTVNLPNRIWQEWMQDVWRTAKKYQGTGSSAARPINGLDVADWYYDTTLGLPIWVHSLGPVVWHNAAGSVV
jgi:hypothetical protein